MAKGHKTGGRQKGTKNKRTAALENLVDKTAEMVNRVLGLDAFQGDAHAFLMLIYKNEKVPVDLRVDAAKAAIRFEKPALSNVDAKTEVTHRYVARLPEKANSTEAWQQQNAPQSLQ